MITKHFEFRSKNIPTQSGCYLFWDENKNLLYVGKAKNLKKRVSNYFQKNKKSPKIELMVSKIKEIETRIVHSEIEALILENNLIKKYHPKFNVLLRDDKNFLYLRVTNEEIPKLEIVRKVIKDGSSYFGPKTSSKNFRETIRFCQKFFGAKMVKESQDYYINQLIQKEISAEAYRKNIEQMKKFLRGQTDEIIRELTEKMMKFAETKNFEAAARARDTIRSIQGATQKQTVEFTDLVDRDFVSFFIEGRNIYLVRLAFRQGKFRDQNEIIFKTAEFNENSEILTQFLTQFYEKVTDFPREIYIPEKLEDTNILETFLSDRFFEGKRVEILVPQKGDKKRILELAEKNARNFAEKSKIEEMSQHENFTKALPELARILDLSISPRRIECYDVSHFSGTHTVASLVVFEDGKPKNSEYKKFNIKSLEYGKIDDFASLTEVLERRFKRITNNELPKNEAKELSKPKGWEVFPDLIVIDGGKGQLHAVLKIFETHPLPEEFERKFNPRKQIISLAKREEEIFIAEKKEPLIIALENPALKLLQRIRDEAHRFAISANRSAREKNQKKSILDEVSGIGTATKKKLMQKFQTISDIREADDSALLEILNRTQLKNIRRQI